MALTPDVIVNVSVVLRDSKVLADGFPGQPIRFPVEEKGRFEPLDADLWKGSYLVAPTGFNALDIEEVHLRAGKGNFAITISPPTPVYDFNAISVTDWHASVDA